MGGRISRSNAPEMALRWSVERAAVEFGVSIATLRKALNRNSARPVEDGCYSTQEIVGALFGELHREKIRSQRALARKLELENAIIVASVLNKDALTRAFGDLADSLAQAVMSSDLNRQGKEDFLRNLRGWPLVLENVAKSQTRLPRSNGQTLEDGQSEDAL
jgi:hypothetical protein